MNAARTQPILLFDTVLPKLELLAWAAAVLGFGAKWLGYYQASPLLVIGLGTAAMVQFLRAYAPAVPPATDATSWQPATPPQDFLQDILLPKIQGIGGAMLLIGTLFKLMFWPGATAPLIAGFFSLLIATAIRGMAGHNSRRSLVLLAMGGVVWAVPSTAWARQFYPNDPARQQQILYRMAHPPKRTRS